nr:MAG TPA: hypothetical protein [Caudoviricetes sp.]
MQRISRKYWAEQSKGADTVSKPRCVWWSYVKRMIRVYEVDRHIADKKKRRLTEVEFSAVEDAIKETKQLIDGAERLRLIDLVLWKRTHTLQGAAMVVYVSERTAQEWHRQFIYLVAEKRGLYSKVCVREP